MEEKVLLIFIRNPELGKVKTRLAASIGNEKALEVYEELLRHTKALTEDIPARKLLFYADNIPVKDAWPAEKFEKYLQTDGDLGLRMATAFDAAFAGNARQVIIIGSDCYELTNAILDQAFAALETQDAVIGPAADGGYYLLGFSRPDHCVFQNKSWSTDSVFQATVQDLNIAGFSYAVLPVLNDVDEEKDLGKLRELL